MIQIDSLLPTIIEIFQNRSIKSNMVVCEKMTIFFVQISSFQKRNEFREQEVIFEVDPTLVKKSK